MPDDFPIDKNDLTQRGQEYLSEGGICITPDSRGYSAAAGQTLLNFQYLETTLRQLLVTYSSRDVSIDKLAEACLAKTEAFEEQTFGTLVRNYQRTFTALVAGERLAELVGPRNDLSHNGIWLLLDRRATSQEYFEEHLRLLNLNRRIIGCWDLVMIQLIEILPAHVARLRQIPGGSTMLANLDRIERSITDARHYYRNGPTEVA